jgi:hypothetical protein
VKPTERERRSQDVEISVESPASRVAALRVALGEFFVGEAFESLAFFALVAVLCVVVGDEVVEGATL